jgi:hypothetical protein
MDYFWKKPKLEPMEDQHFLKCEFLTKEEKVQKNISLDKLSKSKPKLAEGEVALYNTDNQYKVSIKPLRFPIARPLCSKLSIKSTFPACSNSSNRNSNNSIRRCMNFTTTMSKQ